MPDHDIALLKASELRVRRDEEGCLILTYGGRTQPLGSVMGAFPLTRPGRMVSLRNAEGEEIGMLDNVGALDPESRDIMRQELERSYFMPRILDIADIREELNVVTWEVETNRGPRTFQVRNVRQNVRRMGRRRFVVKDVDGNRYEIRDWANLPAPAQKLIEVYL
ncbi:MAG: DUF1854 domain-containing protein [Candidatus Brocadiia bacterium]